MRRTSITGRVLQAAVAAIIVFGVFLAGVVVGGHPQATGLLSLPDGARSVLLGESGRGPAGDVLEVLRRHYYRPVDVDLLERRAVDDMLQALGDPYTVYLDPEELDALRLSNEGRFYGIGVAVGAHGRAVVVERVLPGTPAARAGVRAGDVVAAVDGKAVDGRRLDLAVAAIRGEEGTKVRLRLRRPGRAAPLVLEVPRARMTNRVVSDRLERPGGRRVGYVRLEQFTEGSAGQVRRAVRGLLDQRAEGLVLDLRGNRGGLVTEAIGVASIFLPDDAVVMTTRGLHEPTEVRRARGNPIPTTVPLVVLVDGSSASASEIVAGALRDDGRARLVGTTTFGKALVQGTYALPGGGAVKLTTATYLTPDGHDIGHRGLAPGVRAADDPATPDDEALARALALVLQEASRG